MRASSFFIIIHSIVSLCFANGEKISDEKTSSLRSQGAEQWKRVLKQDGDPCMFHYQCNTGRCIDSKCTVLADGEYCIADYQCSSKTCYNNSCGKLMEGEICSEHCNCYSGLCEGGVCVIREVGEICSTDKNCRHNRCIDFKCGCYLPSECPSCSAEKICSLYMVTGDRSHDWIADGSSPRYSAPIFGLKCAGYACGSRYTVISSDVGVFADKEPVDASISAYSGSPPALCPDNTFVQEVHQYGGYASFISLKCNELKFPYTGEAGITMETALFDSNGAAAECPEGYFMYGAACGAADRCANNKVYCKQIHMLAPPSE